eukprot:TRINITY_DN71428_c0_g1_i1.p1 TRINITY_DN71428_c0_g1~~TRINITY_DN71428_c0_g1_i1.p1  ORF type:complete len:105 (+),score=24.61 TRINITY_DN71428_c0_g1_i1:43-357(+)
MPVKPINNNSAFKEAIAKDSLTVVDFYATWCGPCKAISPKIEEFSNTYSSVTFLKVDVDEAEDIAQQEKISAMPTFKFYKSGSQVAEVIGASSEKVENAIKEHQ